MDTREKDSRVMRASADLRPRLSLAVGVVGHRPPRLAAQEMEAVAARIGAVLRKIEGAAHAMNDEHAASFASCHPEFRLISALAEGADQLAADAALAAGWALDVALPFPREVYEADFPDPSARRRHLEQLSAARCVFELSGERSHEQTAYEAVGRLVLEQSDILLAIWDGDPARGRGGTAQIVEEAVARGLPVVHIDNRTGAAPVLLWAGLQTYGPDVATLDSVPRGEALRLLPGLVQALVEPPAGPTDARMLRRFRAERRRRWQPALAYPLLLALAGVRRMRLADLRAPNAATSRAELELMSAWGHDSVDAPEPREVDELTGWPQGMGLLTARYGAADAGAGYYAQVFRSGFVANFVLSAVAVLLALLGLLLEEWKVVIVTIELTIIATVLGLTHAGRRAGWHERWMDYRHLTERLRCLALLSPLADLGRRTDGLGDGGKAGPVPGWVRWYTRATAREIGLPDAVVDRAYLERVRALGTDLIAGQIAYHDANARRMEKLEHRLHLLGTISFGLTAAACAGFVIYKLLGLGGAGDRMVAEVTTLATAALPAFGAALYGIRMQGEFHAVAERARGIAAQLRCLRADLRAAEPDFAGLSSRLRRVGEAMLADVAHWRVTYQARPLALPA